MDASVCSGPPVTQNGTHSFCEPTTKGNIQFADFNAISSIGGFAYGLTQLLFVYIVIKCALGGKKAKPRVWEGAKGLEWIVPSPAPFHTFETPPKITKGMLEN